METADWNNNVSQIDVKKNNNVTVKDFQQLQLNKYKQWLYSAPAQEVLEPFCA